MKLSGIVDSYGICEPGMYKNGNKSIIRRVRTF